MGHQARSGGTRYIFASPGLAPHRWRPVSSNVRPRKAHQMPERFSTAQSAADRQICWRRRGPSSAHMRGAHRRTGTLHAVAIASTARVFLSLVAASASPRDFLGTGHGQFGGVSAGYDRGTSNTRARHPATPRVGPQQPQFVTASPQARPNQSLKLSANGGPPGPGLWPPRYSHSPGPGVPPLSPA